MCAHAVNNRYFVCAQSILFSHQSSFVAAFRVRLLEGAKINWCAIARIVFKSVYCLLNFNVKCGQIANLRCETEDDLNIV